MLKARKRWKPCHGLRVLPGMKRGGDTWVERVQSLAVIIVRKFRGKRLENDFRLSF
jgi:hypothetical protein